MFVDGIIGSHSRKNYQISLTWDRVIAKKGFTQFEIWSKLTKCHVYIQVYNKSLDFDQSEYYDFVVSSVVAARFFL